MFLKLWKAYFVPNVLGKLCVYVPKRLVVGKVVWKIFLRVIGGIRPVSRNCVLPHSVGLCVVDDYLNLLAICYYFIVYGFMT